MSKALPWFTRFLVAAVFLTACGTGDPGGAGVTTASAIGAVTVAAPAVTTVTIQQGTSGTVLDTFVRSDDMNRKFGKRPHLRVSARTESLIFFDLTAIPANAVIQSASLVLFRNGGDGEFRDDCREGDFHGFPVAPVSVHRATAYWSDRNTTYSNFHQAFDPAVAGTLVPSQPHAFKSVDLTTLVQTWVRGASPNYGVVLTTTGRAHYLFASSNQHNVNQHPALRISYTVPVNHCTSGLCQNGGTCLNNNTAYTCACAAGYTGTNCQTRINNCAGTPCQNGGTCTNGTNTYACTCPAGFTGAQCQTNVDECAPAPCRNGGICSDQIGSYTCACSPDFTGTNCETAVSQCAQSPCQNGGTCTDRNHGYSCNCPVGFTGGNCETFVDYCDGDPCQNGGTCNSGLGSYTCDCAPGYTGTTCQTLVNHCATGLCLNGSTCTNTPTSYTCACAAGYTGANCEVDVDNCAAAPCQHGGSCIDGVNAYTCQCPANYRGTNCEFVVATVPSAPTIVDTLTGPGRAVIAFSTPSDGGSPITSYTVVSTPGGFSATGTASPLVVTGLTNGVSYTFQISATNAVGTSPVSSASATLTPTAPPGAPTVTSVTTGDGTATVGFAPPTDNGGLAILGYVVTSAPGGLTATGSASPLVVRGLTDGTSYTFTVSALNAAGSGPATVPSVTVVPTGVPGAPTIADVAPGNHSATVSFNAPASNGGLAITSYTVTSAPGGYSATGAASPLTVTGLTDGVRYTFTVTATNAAGSSPRSIASSNDVVPTGAPASPSITDVSAGDHTATVSFTPPSDTGGLAITAYTVTSNPGGLTASGGASPLTVTGLTDGTSYTFTVTATNSVGTSGPSPVSATPVVPVGPPGAPTVTTVTPGSGQVLVAFDAPASNGGLPITSYTVTSTPGGLTATGTSSPVSVTGLTNGQAYTFVVVATNSAGSGPVSARSTMAAQPRGVAAAPTDVTVVSSSGAATVSFTAPTDNGGLPITSYVVTSTPGGFVATSATSPVTVTGLTNGQAYTFSVVAVNSDGFGPASSSSSAATPTGPPGAPSIDGVTSGDGVATVSFSPPATNGGLPITVYTITSAPGGITATGASSPIAVSGLTDGVAYTFTVTATNAAGSGAASPATSNGVTPVGAPASPAITNVQAGDSQAVVAFAPPASDGGSPITAYTVVANPGGITGTGTASPITVPGLVDGTTYTFTVVATNAVGTSPVSVTSAPVVPVGPPSPPAVTSVVGNGTGAMLVAFGAPASDGGSPVTGYTVTSIPAGITATGTTSPIRIAGLANGTAYSFTVRATNALGTSAESASFEAGVVVGPPDPPTAVVATVGNGQATVTFSPPASNGGAAIYGYTVTSSPGGLTASGASSPITVTGLVTGVTYTFTVVATNSAGDSASSTASAPVLVAGPPGAPTAPTATGGNGLATVGFMPPASNGGSPVTSYTVKSAPGNFVATGVASPLTVHGLTNGTSYTFTVTATNARGTSSVSASSLAVVPKGVPGPPTSVGAVRIPGFGDRASVSFALPVSNGGSPITSYTVTSSPGNQVGRSSASPILVAGLIPGSPYTFTVTATNGVGTSANSVPSPVFIPSTVPSAPAITGVVPGDSAATVSFVGPASDGGAPIGLYTVTSIPGGLTASDTTSPITVTGLTNGQTYTFTLQATNANGSSPMSDPSSPVTAHGPQGTRVIVPAWSSFVNLGPNGIADYVGIDVQTGDAVFTDGSEADPFTGIETLPAPEERPRISNTALWPGSFDGDGSRLLTQDPDTGYLTTFDWTRFDPVYFALLDRDENATGWVDASSALYLVTTNLTLVNYFEHYTYIWPGPPMYRPADTEYDPVTHEIVAVGRPYTVLPTPPRFRLANSPY